MTRPLLVCEDPRALDDLLRLAATAGVEVDVTADLLEVRRTWSSAPLVVVEAALLERCARARLGRRSGVLVLGDELDDPTIWRRAVDVGAERVLFLPEAEPWLVQALTDAVETAGTAGLVVATLGGRGGGGATTLAVALALAGVRRELRTLLVDGDPLGGGVDLVFGAEARDGLRWPDLTAARGRLPAAAVTTALPELHGVRVLSWDRGDACDLPVEAVDAVLHAARRCCDLVVVDLARSLDDVARDVLAACTCALLVVPAEVRATAAAARIAARAELLCRDLRLVVRGPSPSGIPARELEHALGIPLAGDLKAEPRIEVALEEGQPPGSRSRGPLATFCDGLLHDLAGAQPQRRAA